MALIMLVACIAIEVIPLCPHINDNTCTVTSSAPDIITQQEHCKI